ncbi:MAG TPA: hypothetical protein VF746_00715 [Longimicrobium sp.]|jgi:Arc/MetJ family transcription regulator
MARTSTVRRKNMRIDQEKLDRAKKILGTKTETETVEAALDLVAFRREVYAGLDRIGGSNSIRDLDEFDDVAEDAA